MLNKTILQGRLTKDPELQHTASGVAVTRFRIAVRRDWAANGEEKKSDFFDVKVWRGQAEFVSKYFSKGKMAIVEGRLRNDEYTDSDGKQKRFTYVEADNVYFGERKDDGAEMSGNYNYRDSAPASENYGEANAVANYAEVDDEDVPF